MKTVATLRTVLNNYPHTAALRSGELVDPGVHLDFQDVGVVHKAFAPMVRDQAYDFCELAVVTALQAIAFGRPVVLLPAVVASRFQRGCLIGYGPNGVPAETDLSGKRIGVRAYTQTTGMWVRAHLAEDFGLDIAKVHWITHDPAHVQQYQNPSFVEQIPGTKGAVQMLRDGDVEAAILGNDLPKGDEFIPLIKDAAQRDRAWWLTHRFMPINHMVVASSDACAQQPDAVRRAFALLREADRRSTGADVGVDTPCPTLFGFDRLAGPLDFTIDACMQQGLLPRRLSLEEVFAPARKLLGSDAD
jgi:4,5-dihydroxyphthalate decarboxylase